MFLRSLARLALPFAIALTSCSTSTNSPPADISEAGTDGGQRIISDEVFARKAIAYSGYRRKQGPATLDYPTEEQIKEDMSILLRGGWTYIRLFDSSGHADRVLKVIRDNSFDIKVHLGIWIAGPKARSDKANRDDIERGVALAAMYSDTVVAVSVGNE